MLKWWKAHKNQFPLMSQAVRELLSVPASSSSSERAFSVGGLICSKKRGHLSPKRIEDLALIKLNYFSVKSYVDMNGKPDKSDTVPDDKDFGLEEEVNENSDDGDAESDLDLEYEELSVDEVTEDFSDIELS